MYSRAAVSLAIVFFAACPVLSQDANLQQLVVTEKAFAEMARSAGARQAFLHFLDEQGVLFQPEAVNGREHWQSRPESPALLSWTPVWADISDNGNLGYTTGDWEFRSQGPDDAPVAFGQYITLWKKQDDGAFRAVLDIGISHAKPDQLQNDWESPSEIAEAENRSVDDEQGARPSGLRDIDLLEYQQLLANDVRLYREQQLPFVGKQNALDQIKKEYSGIRSRQVTTTQHEWSGNLMYGYGVLELTRTDDTRERANLLQIWKRRNGRWEMVLEVVAPIPAAEK
jgi:ketosteroid isomerase-like protein